MNQRNLNFPFLDTGEALADEKECGFVEVSAKTGEHVEDVYQLLTRMVMKRFMDEDDIVVVDKRQIEMERQLSQRHRKFKCCTIS